MLAIFDMDGTFLDSMHVWRTASANYVRSRGIEPDEQLAKNIYSCTIRQAMTIIRDMYFPGEQIEEMYAEVLEQIVDNYKTATVKDGAVDLFCALRENGAKLVVASASNSTIVGMIMDRFGLARYFDKIYTSVDKKTPDAFYDIARDFNEDPSDCVVFEDALYSMKNAKAAGMRVLAVYDRSAEKQQEDIKKISDWYYTTLNNTDSIIKSLGL